MTRLRQKSPPRQGAVLRAAGDAALQKLPVLTFAGGARPGADTGEPGEFAWLPLDQLYIDAAYQREILQAGKANIRRMIEEFSWSQFGALAVGRRASDAYAIIDGQHRATAALNHGGIDKVPCIVFTIDAAAEARAFAGLHRNTTRPHPLQSFKAAVAAGEPESVRLATICMRADVLIAGRPKTTEMKPGETCALRTMQHTLRRDGEEVLFAALTVLRVLDPDAPLAGAAVAAACLLAHRHAEWRKEPERIAAMLKRGGTLAQLLAKAQTRKITRGGPEYINLAAVFETQISLASAQRGVPLDKLMGGR